MSEPETFPKVRPNLAFADDMSGAMPQPEISAGVPFDTTLVAESQAQVSHPEIADERRPEELHTITSSAQESQPEIPTEALPRTPIDDPPPRTYSHPEISAEISPEDTSAKANSATLSQPNLETFGKVQPESDAIEAVLPTFSHPEISEEIQPEGTLSSETSTQPELDAVDAVLPAFSHPEISEEIRSEDKVPSEISASGSPPGISTEVPPEKTTTDQSPSIYAHPEISEVLRPEEPSAVALSEPASQIEISVEVRPESIILDPVQTTFSHAEISQEIVREDTSADTTSATSSPPERSAEVPCERSIADAMPATTFLHPDVSKGPEASASPMLVKASQPDSSAAYPSKSTTSGAMLTPTASTDRTPRIRPGAGMPSASATLATTSEPHTSDAADVDFVSITAIAGALPKTFSGITMAEEVPSVATSASAISDTVVGSEDYPEVRTEISRKDRKAIIDALSRKTVSQDAIFEPIYDGERKYLSDKAARKTITDHSKDFEEITLAEREALMDAAIRRTVVQPDRSLSPFQAVDIPVWYTNPISTTMSDIEKDAYATIGMSAQKPSSAASLPAVVAKSEISEEVVPMLTIPPVTTTKSMTKPRIVQELRPEISTGERKDVTNASNRKKVPGDASMEVIPEARKFVSGTAARDTTTDHSKDGAPTSSTGRRGLIDAGRRETDLEPDTPILVPGFPIDPPLMPFSKKERRELVRSISMQIKEPELPLWDMDLADISEAEEAKKNFKPSPQPFDTAFDFDEPIRPKAPVRRSKRHRIVRVHATDYARAHAVESQEFCTNKITSTKYTLMTFLPMNLFYQCSRAANLYFILIAAIQLIPGFSPTSWGTTVVPLVLVLLLNAIKEGIDEFKRSVSDRTVNKQMAEVLNENSFVVTKWSSVIVGDIVRVKSDQEFPADLVFLSSADAKGLAYVETANLDGETNLKIRNAFYKRSSTGEEDETPLSIFSGLTIECELPNNRLYKFEGAINLQDYGKLPLDTRQILLRGATLRNTEWILGVVVYTGADTKFVRNMIPGQIKITELERNMNILVAIVFMCQVAICLGLAAANDVWTRDDDNDTYFIPDFNEVLQHIGPKPHTIGAQFGRFLILLNQLIPISLYVTLEVVKVVQSYYIDWDVHMYHTGSKTHAKARTTNLNEELGQVQYVMADKTGTLTQNIMAFVQCSIGGVVYGTIQHEGGLQVGATKSTIHTLANDPKLTQKLSEVAAGASDSDSKFLRAFFLHLAICHVVHPMLAKKGEGGLVEDTVLKYTGASPDEEALVQGAADCGYELRKRAQDELIVFVPDGIEILHGWHFVGYRIKLYCKGADSVIFKRLARGQEDLMDTSLNQLEDFARCGYRTMCMAERQISGKEYENWAARFRAASIALDDRDEKLAAVSETIERDMMLLGVTAVEDKLQGKVPETITLLAQAGIKVWVLTGDKLETSVSVALSCNLLADSMHLFLLSDNVSKSVPQLLRSMLDEARRQHRSKLKMEGSDYHSEMATVIEGSSLAVALEEANKLLLLELLKFCRSVVCCRVSPIQKAQVTLLLKDHGKSVILAIGDGANDCGMIKVAQIGVGIGGREGMAAVLASDYSLTRFRYLRRLLLVHGRWSYKRNRELVMYAFYKNIVYALGNAYLAFYSGYSSQALYSAVEIATYNLIWTSLPTIAGAVFNKDLSDCTAENNPQLYMESQSERIEQFFWCLTGWALSAFWDSLVAFFLPLAAASVSEKYGESISIREIGSIVYTMAVFIVNVKIISRMQNLNWFHFAAFNISTSLWLLVLFCLAFALKLSGFFPDLAGVGQVVTQRPVFWLLLFLCPVVASLPYCTFEIFRNQQAPADFEVMREIEHGWTDGYFFPDAPDYVEQITAPIPLRRTSLEFPEEDYGPSPLQKEIADAREAVLVESGGLSKPPETEGTKDLTEAGGAAPTLPSAQVKVDDNQLRPRRLTWREVVNDDELEDLATSASLGRDGRRRSNGFQVVTRHTDAPEAPVPLARGPAPTQRKSVLFQQDVPLITAPTTVATRRASLKTPALPQQQKQQQQKQQQKPQQQKQPPQQPEDSQLKAVRANLAKHAEERRTLVPGPGASTPKKTKKRQKIWDAVKEGSAERDPYSSRDRRHPLQRMRPPGSSSSSSTTTTTTTTRPSATTSPRAGGRGGHAPRSSKPPMTAQPTRFDPMTNVGKEHSRPSTPRTEGRASSPGAPKPPHPPPAAGFRLQGDSKGPRTGPGHSRLNS